MWWKSVVWPVVKTLGTVFLVSGTVGTAAYLVKTVSSSDADVLRGIQNLLSLRLDD